MRVLVLDTEADSLHPTEFHMIGVLDYATDEFTDYHGDEIVDGLCDVDDCEILLVFNQGYDIKHIRRLTENVVSLKKPVIIDVLELSRKYMKNFPNHKLKTWGEFFNFPKGDFNDFTKYTPEMGIYCERDCRITKKAFDYLRDLIITTTGVDILLEAIEDAQRRQVL